MSQTGDCKPYFYGFELSVDRLTAEICSGTRANIQEEFGIWDEMRWSLVSVRMMYWRQICSAAIVSACRLHWNMQCCSSYGHRMTIQWRFYDPLTRTRLVNCLYIIHILATLQSTSHCRRLSSEFKSYSEGWMEADAMRDNVELQSNQVY